MNTKKFATVLLALVLAVSLILAGCGEDKKEETKKDTETTVNADNDVQVDASEDKEVDVNTDAEAEADSVAGYTTAELEAALLAFTQNGDIEALKAYVLPETTQVIEAMRMYELDFEDYSIVDYYGCVNLSGIENSLAEITKADAYMETDIPYNAANPETGEITEYRNIMDYENVHLVTEPDCDLYSVTKDAVNGVNVDEKIEYVSLSSVALYVEYGEEGSVSYSFFAVETNVGWFILCQLT